MLNLTASDTCALDTNIDTGGGTDDTTCLQGLIDSIYAAGGGTLYLDGYARITNTLVLKSNVTIDATGGGVFLTANTNKPMLTTVLSGATKSNDDVAITGGTWNGNATNQARWENNSDVSPNVWVVGIWLGSTDGITLTNVTIKNSRTFALVLSHSSNITITNYTANWTVFPDVEGGCNQDCMHVWGTVENLTVNGITSNGDDDVVALNTTENLTYD